MKFSRSKPDEQLASRRRVGDDDEMRRVPREQSTSFRRGQSFGRVRVGDHEQQSHRHRLHHLSHRRRKVGGVFLLLIGAIVLLFLILTQLIAQVSVTSGSTTISRAVDPEPYVQTIDEYFTVNPVERLRFALNESALQSFVQQAHPEVASLQLASVSDMVRAQFSLEFREPLAGWRINNQQNYVDSDGVVFTQNYYGNQVVQIVDESGISPEQGSAVASARLLSFVGQLTHATEGRGYVVESVTLSSGMTRQLELRLEGVSSVIRVSIDRGAGEQAEDADRAWQYLQARNRSPEYIDVRSEGSAVYR